MLSPMLFNTGGPPTGRAVPGTMGAEDFEEFRKALEAGYGADHATLVGGGAIRIESLEGTLMSTVQSNVHFRLLNKLMPGSRAGATVDEWTEKDDIGGYPGSAFNTELGDIAERTGSYKRRVAQVKYLMTRRAVSFVQMQQNTIVSSQAEEQVNGTLELLTSAEWSCFEGNSDVLPEQFDGLTKILTDLGSTDHVLDAEAKTLDPKRVIHLAAVIAGKGNFGRATDIYSSQLVQADLDNTLDPAFRVPLTDIPGGGIQYGAPVRAIRTSWGDIAANPNVFIQEGEAPFEVRYPGLVTSQDPTPPDRVEVVLDQAVDSKFAQAHAGTYRYAVAGISKNGESRVVKSDPVDVSAGDKVTITITSSAAGDETGYVIYRSRKDGTDATDDFREMLRVPRAGATTVVEDLNRDIPGTSKLFVLNQAPGYNAIGIRQLLPMTKFQLYPTTKAEVPWAQLLFIYLRVTKARQHAMVKNILPTGATWRPF